MSVDQGFAYNPTTQTCDDLNPSMLQPYPHHQYQRKHHLPLLLRSFLKLQSHLQSALGLEGITRTCFLYKIILNGFVNILWFTKLYLLKNALSFANPDSTLIKVHLTKTARVLDHFFGRSGTAESYT